VVPGSARADICPMGYLLGKDRVLERRGGRAGLRLTVSLGLGVIVRGIIITGGRAITLQ